jgi:hypothetical protein
MILANLFVLVKLLWLNITELAEPERFGSIAAICNLNKKENEAVVAIEATPETAADATSSPPANGNLEHKEEIEYIDKEEAEKRLRIKVAESYKNFGLILQPNNDINYREWAPSAKALSIVNNRIVNILVWRIQRMES